MTRSRKAARAARDSDYPLSPDHYPLARRELRAALLEAQFRLRRDPRFAAAVIIAGPPAAGRSEIVNELLEWLDPKFVHVHAFHPPGREEQKLPVLHRYWRTLPARGCIAFYFTGWYEEYFAEALRRSDTESWNADRIVERIRQLESMLIADGVSVLKAYLAIDANVQRERLAALRSNRLTRWRVTGEDLRLAKQHGRLAQAASRCIGATNQASARWHVVDGSDERGRLTRVARLLLEEIDKGFRQARRVRVRRSRGVKVKRAARQLGIDVPQEVSDDAYQRDLQLLQGRLARLVRRRAFRKRALVMAFEGMDAAGKGGSIRRITHALDARQYRVIPVSAPTPQEAAYPYLWRFWRSVPELGAISIYDRSWYGRVLVERVRGLTPPADWMRAYDEIREFELQLAEHGIIVAKFWLSVSKQEQLRRFRAREANRLKRFKVDKEDWTNRRYYDDYQSAAEEMIERTQAGHAPWTVAPADHKKTARLIVLETVCDALEHALARG